MIGWRHERRRKDATEQRRLMPDRRDRRQTAPFFDLYGHTPAQHGTYKTWTGFVLSVLLFCAVGASCSYVLFEYFTLPYDLSEANVPNDESFAAKPESHPAVPDFGVRFELSNFTVFPVHKFPEVVDILFWQIFVEGNGSTFDLRTRVRLATERCRFLGEAEDDPGFDAYCPAFGNIITKSNETTDLEKELFEMTGTAENVSVRENASVPWVQAQLLDPLYASVEAMVQVNVTALNQLKDELDIDLEDIYQGNIIFFLAMYENQINDFTIKQFSRQTAKKLPIEYKLFHRQVSVKEFALSKVTVSLARRCIERTSVLVDLEAFQIKTCDLIITAADVDLDDAEYIPRLFKLQESSGILPNVTHEDGSIGPLKPVPVFQLASVFFQMSRDFKRVTLTPSATFVDILGVIGGFISLFSFVIGLPAMLINQYLFRKQFQKARLGDMIPEEYFDQNGDIRIEHVNDVLEIIERTQWQESMFPEKKLSVTACTKPVGHEWSITSKAPNNGMELEMSCSECHTRLGYPGGASGVECPVCSTVTSVGDEQAPLLGATKEHDDAFLDGIVGRSRSLAIFDRPRSFSFNQPNHLSMNDLAMI